MNVLDEIFLHDEKEHNLVYAFNTRKEGRKGRKEGREKKKDSFFAFGVNVSFCKVR